MPSVAHSYRERPVEADGLPAAGLVRLDQILAVLPISRSTFFGWVKAGKFPRPIKIGARTAAWRVEDVRALLHSAEVTADTIDPNAAKAVADRMTKRAAAQAADAEKPITQAKPKKPTLTRAEKAAKTRRANEKAKKAETLALLKRLKEERAAEDERARRRALLI